MVNIEDVKIEIAKLSREDLEAKFCEMVQMNLYLVEGRNTALFELSEYQKDIEKVRRGIYALKQLIPNHVIGDFMAGKIKSAFALIKYAPAFLDISEKFEKDETLQAQFMELFTVLMKYEKGQTKIPEISGK